MLRIPRNVTSPTWRSATKPNRDPQGVFHDPVVAMPSLFVARLGCPGWRRLSACSVGTHADAGQTTHHDRLSHVFSTLSSAASVPTDRFAHAPPPTSPPVTR